ncbi:UDPGP type 1 family protein [Paenibacillus sp. J2TS4]|uniref:UTP--glucose-1-phosphate uridylyltransferase n=1 Tax=Paenibacillus sp. J2TS4 TaxID=2807194 RepID=UPI001B28C32D|nr:UDPGP type 1 family protein [Paenibacillus sp. J2TS4]GIP32713.1 UDP-N-acetylhexosamine pyrophosphorylase [Paenibacillus sp. J2TS4]
MKSTREQAEAFLQQHDQQHLLKFYDQLTPESQEQLLDQILSLDLDKVVSLFESTTALQEQVEDDLVPIEAGDWESFSEEEKHRYEELGWEALRSGRVGAIVVAGGQGSRLGHPGPKGTYNIGLPSGKSLFQLQAERLINLSGRAGRTIPWYIMTSPENHAETVEAFQRAAYFGYPLDHLYFFEQSVLPAIDSEGKILLAEPGRISLAPAGNGDCFAAIKRSGALDDMKARQIEWLFYYNVDNALVKVADPKFIGYTMDSQAPAACKVVPKSHPEEKVGIVCLNRGRPAVIEYSDLPRELMLAKNEQGNLLYDQANISMHLFHMDFVEKGAELPLPYHAAHKKVAAIDEQGHPVTPSEPNAYKFERFIFDLFPLADKLAVLQVNRSEEFAPVKNKEGEDSPETARSLVLELHRKWLLEAGVGEERIANRTVEISPLTSYSGEGLHAEQVPDPTEKTLIL